MIKIRREQNEQPSNTHRKKHRNSKKTCPKRKLNTSLECKHKEVNAFTIHVNFDTGHMINSCNEIF